VKRMRALSLTTILGIAIALLAGCGGATATATPEGLAGFETYNSPNLDQSYEGALPASSQLALGTIELEGTGNAVTPEQAAVLLPLWQALQSGELQGSAETNAVLAQIERAMTPGQLQAIAAMKLTWEDMQAWAANQGLVIEPRPGQGPDQTRPGQGMAPEAQQTARAGFQSMSEEERAARMEEMQATAEAGGMTFPAEGDRPGFGQPGAGVARSGPLLEPLIELLTQRAGS
jgi:hypothetical protein